jgi:hypothetical protein
VAAGASTRPLTRRRSVPHSAGGAGAGAAGGRAAVAAVTLVAGVAGASPQPASALAQASAIAVSPAL